MKLKQQLAKNTQPPTPEPGDGTSTARYWRRILVAAALIPLPCFNAAFGSSGAAAEAPAEEGACSTCPPQPTGHFFADFETGDDGFTVDTRFAPLTSPTWSRLPDLLLNGYSFFTDNAGTGNPVGPPGYKDDRLVSPPQRISDTSKLIFKHRYTIEEPFDGGAIEASSDGWTDILLYDTTAFEEGGYDQLVYCCSGNPMPFRWVWTGASAFYTDQMVQVTVDLSAVPNDYPVSFRWRFGADALNRGFSPAIGWRVDDIEFTNLLEDVNCAPDGVADAASTDENVPIEIDVLVNDCDPNGEPLSIMNVQSTTDLGGAALLDDKGDADPTNDVIAYTPPADTSGDDQFTYEVCDLEPLCTQVTVTVTIAEDAPGICSALGLAPIFSDDFNLGADPSVLWARVENPLGHLNGAGPALGSTDHGLSVLVDHSSAGGTTDREHFVLDRSPDLAEVYCAEFLFSPNGIELDGRLKVFAARGDDGNRILRLMLRENPIAGRQEVAEEGILPYQLRMSATNDNGAWVNLGWIDVPDAESLVSMLWIKGDGSANGEFRLFVDALVVDERLAFNNDERTLGAQAIGNLGLFKDSTVGTVLWDEFGSFGLSAPVESPGLSE